VIARRLALQLTKQSRNLSIIVWDCFVAKPPRNDKGFYMKRTGERTNIISEVLGWYGVVAILGAYAALTFGLLASNGLWYPILNATGAAGLVIDTYFQKDYQPLVLNAVWVLVAVIALLKYFF
jgi:hypothetical protein